MNEMGNVRSTRSQVCALVDVPVKPCRKRRLYHSHSLALLSRGTRYGVALHELGVSVQPAVQDVSCAAARLTMGVIEDTPWTSRMIKTHEIITSDRRLQV